MTTVTARVGDTLIATTDDPIVVEGNVCFPGYDIINGVLIASKARVNGVVVHTAGGWHRLSVRGRRPT